MRARLAIWVAVAIAACRGEPPQVDVRVEVEQPIAPARAPIPAPPPAEAPPPEAGAPPAPAEPPVAPAEPPADPLAPSGRIGAGDSISRIAASFGLDAAAIAELVAALGEVMDPQTIREGQRWSAQLDADRRLVSLMLQRNATTHVEVVRGPDGKLTAKQVERETDVEVATLVGTIDSSLSATVVDAGGDAALVAAIVDVFASRIDFYTDPRKGDRVALVYERHRLDGEHVRIGRVLAAEYRGDVGTIRGLWWTPPGASEGTWYTDDGKSLDRTLLKSPLKYARMSSGFDPKRMHPVLHRVKGHYGVDYAAPTGTPVWAAAGGKIAFRGPKGGAGNMVVLAHDGGFSTVYMHLSKFAEGQKVGATVAQKTVIGYVGTTGLSTGPHLHFGVKRGGKWVDPEGVRAIERAGVAKKQRARFERDTQDVRAQLDALLAPPP